MMSKEKKSVRSVSRKLVNALRRDRRDNPSLESMMASETFRRTIISRKNEHNADAKRLREKFIKEESIHARACVLFDQFRNTCENIDPKIKNRKLNNLWAQAVQAVKTDKVDMLQQKYGTRQS